MNSAEENRPLEMETSLLQALCAAGWASLPRRLKARLRQYSWRTPEHQIVFEALQQTPPGPCALTRGHLQAALVRMGFPDIEFEAGASDERLTEEQIGQLLEKMETLLHRAAKGQ